MKLNLSITAAQVDSARKPELGWESKAYFAPENCILVASVLATAAAVGELTSAGGLGIPVAGRDLLCRVSSAFAAGAGGNMTVKIGVTMDDDTVDTATATFQVPTYTASSVNQFPMGVSSDFVPDTIGNIAKKIKTITGLTSVTNQTPGNAFELYTTPESATFVYIDVTRSKGGALNLPGYVEIPDRLNPAAFVKLGRGESNKIKLEYETRGALEQLGRFNGSTGTLRLDVLKDDKVLSERIMFTDYIVRANGDRGDGNDVVKNTSEGPYQRFFIGYARVAS